MSDSVSCAPLSETAAGGGPRATQVARRAALCAGSRTRVQDLGVGAASFRPAVFCVRLWARSQDTVTSGRAGRLSSCVPATLSAVSLMLAPDVCGRVLTAFTRHLPGRSTWRVPSVRLPWAWHRAGPQ